MKYLEVPKLMSIIGNFLQISSQQLEALIAAPEEINSVIYMESNDSRLDIDKAWHGIHFMLTGQQYDGTPPLSNVIFSASTVGDDLGYGPARYLTATDVTTVAELLKSLLPADFAKRYDADALIENDIYPQAWSGDEDLDYLLSWYSRLRNYYLDATSKNNAMLQYLS